jgi:hypothetical protein
MPDRRPSHRQLHHPSRGFVAAAKRVDDADLVGWLAEHGKHTVYTPDTMMRPRSHFGPHLQLLRASARGGGSACAGCEREFGDGASLVPAGCALVGVVLLAFGSREIRSFGALLVVAYGAVVTGSAILAAARFRSSAVGALAAPGLMWTQGAYVAGVVRGLAPS